MARRRHQTRTYDTSTRRLADFLRRELRGQVERHEVLDAGIDRLQLGAVEQGLLGVGDGRLQVGLRCTTAMRWGHLEGAGQKTCHNIGKRESALADVRGDDLGQLALAEVDMEICWGSDRDGFCCLRHGRYLEGKALPEPRTETRRDTGDTVTWLDGTTRWRRGDGRLVWFGSRPKLNWHFSLAATSKHTTTHSPTARAVDTQGPSEHYLLLPPPFPLSTMVAAGSITVAGVFFVPTTCPSVCSRGHQ